MSRSTTSPTSRTSQDSPVTRSSPPESLPAHDSRNRNSCSQDELHDADMATNHDDHSHQQYATRYKFYKTERNKYRDRCTELEAMLEEKDDQLEQLEQEARDHEMEAKEREKAVTGLMEEFERLRERERIRSEELSVAQTQHEETKRILKKKVEELEGMQVFEEMLKRLEQKARDHKREAEEQEKVAARLMDEFKRLREQESIRSHEVSMAEKRHEETNRLLKAKVEALEGMQVLTRKADPPLISSDRCAKLPKPASSPPNRGHGPGQDPNYHEREMEKREKEMEELKVELKKLEEKERRKDHELSLLEKQHNETKRALQSQTDELYGMTRADLASVSDVVDFVKVLNATILQAASFLSDPQHLSSLAVEASDQDIQQATDDIRAKLGEEMAEAVQALRNLRKELDPEDPTAVQVALQIAMNRVCNKMINAWTRSAEAERWLSGMYEKIRASETQNVAGRWRALTRARAGGAKDPEVILTHLINRLGLVLLAVGSKVSADQFRSNFEIYLTSIADHVIRIQTAIGESITSVDVMPYFYPPGTEFEDDSMEDMYGSHRTTKDSRKGPILGTVELGLWQKEKTTDANGKSKDQSIPLYKAKVVLAASLYE